jgi:thiosulfate/3-mercaptopyruvate sulfurtransferase
VEPLAPHERVFVDSDFANDENHGKLGCEECHGGDPADPNWKTAHQGMRKDPSFPDPSQTCGQCHEEIAESAKHSLHMTLSPFHKITDLRASPDKSKKTKVDHARKTHCSKCHSSCGQCHVSRPNYIGGGLLESHLFQKQPPTKAVCTGCHGGRIEKEYFGKNKGIPADIHSEKHFKCTKCHSAAQMHADGRNYANRYEVEYAPDCVDCHQNIYEKTEKHSKTHNEHRGKVSCHVCHSMPYKNCFGCHFGKDDKGKNYYQTDMSKIDFKIGLNPLQSQSRPEKFVILRHIPIDQDSYKYYVEDGLNRFDNLPTWKFATPHTIRRKTPQNKSCNSCHGNSRLFLNQKDVKPKYLKANQSVIVPTELIPVKIDD